MIQGSAVYLVRLKASDSSENLSNKVIIFCREQNKLRKNYIAMS